MFHFSIGLGTQLSGDPGPRSHMHSSSHYTDLSHDDRRSAFLNRWSSAWVESISCKACRRNVVNGFSALYKMHRSPEGTWLLLWPKHRFAEFGPRGRFRS